MCRWIAYRGDPIALERYVTEPPRSLIIQSYRAQESTAALNGDGFGLGWYGEQAEPGLYREIRPAWSDDNLQHLCRHIRSHLFFAHVRASTGTPVTRPNCHPFVTGSWMFMHNGYVGDWARTRRPVELMVPDALYPDRMGSTDSEALFLAIMGAGGARDPLGATARVLAAVTRLLAGQNGRLRFTSALADGRNLYAFRFAFNDQANTLYYRVVERGILVVSEPLDDDRALWKPVPEGRALAIGGDGSFEVVPFMERYEVAAQ
jgi:predicted glutamine amidotransferase